MILINFAHPITPLQREQLAELLGEEVEVYDIPVQFDEESSFTEQAAALVASVPLDAVQWQSEPILVNLPSLNTIAALVIAHIIGRRGDLPDVLRLRRDADAAATRYVVGEIIKLSASRANARSTRM